MRIIIRLSGGRVSKDLFVAIIFLCDDKHVVSVGHVVIVFPQSAAEHRVSPPILLVLLRCINKNPIDWFPKKQATVEMATCGSEFMAAKTAIQQCLGTHPWRHYPLGC